MKNNSLFAKIAVAAMAVTALASPVAAFAAAGPALSKQYAISQASLTGAPAQFASAKAVSLSAAVQLPDPTELAAKYAPDTVQEWKQTLATYNKLVQGKGALTLTLTAVPAATASSLAETARAAFPVTAMNVQQGSLTAPAGTVSLQAVKIVDGGNLKSVAIGTSRAEGTVATAAASASPAGTGILTGRIALGEAVGTGDAAKIKQALDKLLAQYKAIIAELQQAE
ncbi:hypothetical protein [Cohnella sp. GCM10012308]|uniref:hypothetical protein n=1 Tax=Cohnella sp. GCM10012308 TaxID=3317329 RepID=UPI00360E8A1A